MCDINHHICANLIADFSNSLKKQLATPELQSVNTILVGELKAVEMLMDEFAQLFELVEVDEKDPQKELEESGQ